MKWGHMENSLGISDSELISMLPEDEEHIKNLIYEEYGYLIDVILHKYSKYIRLLQIDEQEIFCEASYGFSDGINSFVDDKKASLKTFLSLCIERRVTKYINKYTTQKAQMLRDALSLDHSVGEGQSPLMDMVSDDKFDPLNNLTSMETFNEIMMKAKEYLSEFEYIVFSYMINQKNYHQIANALEKTPKQIDNTIQRIKLKIRKILEDIQ